MPVGKVGRSDNTNEPLVRNERACRYRRRGPVYTTTFMHWDSARTVERSIRSREGAEQDLTMSSTTKIHGDHCHNSGLYYSNVGDIAFPRFSEATQMVCACSTYNVSHLCVQPALGVCGHGTWPRPWHRFPARLSSLILVSLSRIRSSHMSRILAGR